MFSEVFVFVQYVVLSFKLVHDGKLRHSTLAFVTWYRVAIATKA